MGWDKFLDHVQFDLGMATMKDSWICMPLWLRMKPLLLHNQSAIMEGVHVFGISNSLEN